MARQSQPETPAQRLDAGRERLLQVKQRVEEIYETLWEIQKIVQVGFDRQSELPSGKVSREDYQASPLGQRHRAGSPAGYAPPATVVVLGFWWADGVRYVTSGQGAKILSAADREVPRLMQIANTWRTKQKHAPHPYQDYLSVRRSLWLPEFATVQAEMNALGALMRQSVSPAAAEPSGPFEATEAEARMATYLIGNRVAGDVHFYATHSPCLGCCRTLAALGGVARRLEEFRGNPAAYSSPRFGVLADGPERFRWQLGGAFYGRVYPTTRFDLLDDAVRTGGILGYENSFAPE
jgi:hypothetical protein